jgi:hypothetical protein
MLFMWISLAEYGRFGLRGVPMVVYSQRQLWSIIPTVTLRQCEGRKEVEARAPQRLARLINCMSRDERQSCGTCEVD